MVITVGLRLNNVEDAMPTDSNMPSKSSKGITPADINTLSKRQIIDALHVLK